VWEAYTFAVLFFLSEDEIYILFIFFVLSSKLLNRFSQFLFIVLNILLCSLLFVDTHT